MLARLSSADYPALSYLKTRDDDDFTIALIDAASVMLDILTFYQERLANESYLRTATQLDSLTQLSRLVGYQPAPAIAASTYLAFTMKVPAACQRTRPPRPSRSRPARRYKAFPRKDRRRSRSRPPPTSWPSRTGTRCPC